MSAHEGAECRPPEGTPDCSVHWLKHKDGTWEIHEWLCGDWFKPRDITPWTPTTMAKWWTYSHQASPHDATELAALRDRVAEMETALETIGRLLAGQNGAVAASLAAIVSDALQCARKEG